MAQLGRKEAEQLIKEILTEYARKIRSAKKREYAEDIQQQLFNPKIDAFYKLVKSEDMDFYIFNRLNDEGIRQLLVGCRRLAKCYELDSYGKIKDFTYAPDAAKCRIASDSDGKYTAGGSYTFTLEGKAELGNKWYEPYRVVWHFYRENPGTGKYEETASKMDEARALADFDTWDRSFLVSEKGRYKVTATIFNQAITTGIRPDIVEVCELYFEARDDSDAEIVKLSTFEKCVLAISYADFGETFKNLGLDIAAVAVTVVAFVGIGVILKKIPAGKVKPLLMKLARKLNLSELLEFFGKVGDAFDVVALIESICSFYEQASNARNREHLKAAGKTLEKIVEALGLFAVFDFMTIIGGGMKKADVENEIKALDDVPKRKVEVEDIIGKKANDLVDLPEEYEFVHVTDKDGVVQRSIRRKDATVGEKLFVDGDGYVQIADESIVVPKTNGIKNVPRSNGEWTGTAGNSKWIPDDDFIPSNPKTNPDNLTWKQIKNKYDITDIPFNKGEPDFTKISKGKVTVLDFSSDRDANFDIADALLAEMKGCEPEDVQKWRKVHKYTWHECNDCKTLLKVPTEVHGNIPHAGGISEIKKTS